jgi:hypothetical protein
MQCYTDYIWIDHAVYGGFQLSDQARYGHASSQTRMVIPKTYHPVEW